MGGGGIPAPLLPNPTVRNLSVYTIITSMSNSNNPPFLARLWSSFLVQAQWGCCFGSWSERERLPAHRDTAAPLQPVPAGRTTPPWGWAWGNICNTGVCTSMLLCEIICPSSSKPSGLFRCFLLFLSGPPLPVSSPSPATYVHRQQLIHLISMATFIHLISMATWSVWQQVSTG